MANALIGQQQCPRGTGGFCDPKGRFFNAEWLSTVGGHRRLNNRKQGGRIRTYTVGLQIGVKHHERKQKQTLPLRSVKDVALADLPLWG